MFQVGELASNFQASALLPGAVVKNDFDMFEYTKGRKVLLFFYPLDFTFVCPSELLALSDRQSLFAERNTITLAISIDSIYTHLAWQSTGAEHGGLGSVDFPMISDLKQEICRIYGVQHPSDAHSLRASIILDEGKIIRHASVNDLAIGRNIDELLRTIDAIDHNSQYGEVCPAQWMIGKEAMEASREGVIKYLSSKREDNKRAGD